jgi:hypothetical protein
MGARVPEGGVVKRPSKQSASPVSVVRGRPLVHTEPWEKITVVLLDRHVGYLDIMCVLMRMRHGKAIARAELIRAFIEFMDRSGIDFTQFASMDDMVAFLAKRFGELPRRGRQWPLLLESSFFQPPSGGRHPD